MKIGLALVFSLMPLLAGAEIYQSVDSEGNVVFSDKPSPGAKEIPKQLTPTYATEPLPQGTAAAASVAPSVVGYYSALRFRRPTPGETVRDATGALTIELTVEPPLKTQEGHVLVVAVDGNNLVSHDKTTQLTISNVANGDHTLKAQIMDATGQVQFSSDSIAFHMQRASGSDSPSPSVRQGAQHYEP